MEWLGYENPNFNRTVVNSETLGIPIKLGWDRDSNVGSGIPDMGLDSKSRMVWPLMRIPDDDPRVLDPNCQIPSVRPKLSDTECRTPIVDLD